MTDLTDRRQERSEQQVDGMEMVSTLACLGATHSDCAVAMKGSSDEDDGKGDGLPPVDIGGTNPRAKREEQLKQMMDDEGRSMILPFEVK